MAFDPGTKVGPYLLEEVVGHGAMSVVYRARHVHLHTSHAVKILTTTSPRVQRRLIKEGRAQGALDHPNIVSVDEVVVIESSPGLVMEYIDGPTLEDLLKEGPLPLGQLEPLAREILSAMDVAHAHGLIHRDVKPANIMLEPKEGGGWTPKVTDFGLVKILEEEGANATLTNNLRGSMGTPQYQAPEQLDNAGEVGFQADIFSLGAVLYEMAVGQRAFNAPNVMQVYRQVIEGDYRPPREIAPQLPIRIETALVGALQVDVGHRIPNCETLLKVWDGRASWDPATGSLVSMVEVFDEPTLLSTGIKRPRKRPRTGEPKRRPIGLIVGAAAATFAAVGCCTVSCMGISGAVLAWLWM